MSTRIDDFTCKRCWGARHEPFHAQTVCSRCAGTGHEPNTPSMHEYGISETCEYGQRHVWSPSWAESVTLEDDTEFVVDVEMCTACLAVRVKHHYTKFRVVPMRMKYFDQSDKHLEEHIVVRYDVQLRTKDV